MNIVYLGSGQFGIECLDALANSVDKLILTITQLPRPSGRGRTPKSTPVASWAKSHSVAFIETDDVNGPDVIDRVTAYKPDLIVVIAFGQKIGNLLTNLPSKGAINVHASLLPEYRGAAPINWAIINGENRTGISIITLAEKMDAGSILAQAETDIEDNETAGQLHDRLAAIAAPLLLETIEKIADGSIVYTEQKHSEATLAPKLKKTDGFLDFSNSAESLRRRILGSWPWPGASAIYIPLASLRADSKKTSRRQRVTIAMADPVVETSNLTKHPAGTIDSNLNVICGENALKITKIKPAGRRLMDFKDFINGSQVQPGDMFVKVDEATQ